MSIWDYVFDNDYLQRRDIELLKERIAQQKREEVEHKLREQSTEPILSSTYQNA